MITKRRIYVAVMLMMAILFGLLLMEMPLFMDDTHFTEQLPEGSNFSLRLHETIAIMSNCLQTDMFRLPNQLIPPLLMLIPKWMKVVIMVFIFMLAVDGGRRAMRLSVSSSLTYLWLAALVLLFPWYDYMMCTAFFMNYLFPTALTLWLLYYVSVNPVYRRSNLGFICVMILAYLTGWSHEAFSVPLFLFICVLLVQNYRESNRCDYRGGAVLCSLGLGILTIACSPILRTRVSHSMSIRGTMPLWELIMVVGPISMFTLLFITVSLICLKRDKLILQKLMPTYFALMAAILIGFTFMSGPRALWPASLFAVYGTIYALGDVYAEFWSRLRVYCVLMPVCVVLSGSNLVYAAVSQPKFTREIEAVGHLYSDPSNLNGEVFYDVTRPPLDWALLKTSARVLNERTPLEFMSYLYDKEVSIKVLPSKLADFKIPSSFSAGDAIVYENMVITDMSRWEELQMRIPVLTLNIDGEEAESRYRVDTFHASDGSELVLLTPHIVVINPGVHIISAVIE